MVPGPGVIALRNGRFKKAGGSRCQECGSCETFPRSTRIDIDANSYARFIITRRQPRSPPSSPLCKPGPVQHSRGRESTTRRGARRSFAGIFDCRPRDSSIVLHNAQLARSRFTVLEKLPALIVARRWSFFEIRVDVTYGCCICIFEEAQHYPAVEKVAGYR